MITRSGVIHRDSSVESAKHQMSRMTREPCEASGGPTLAMSASTVVVVGDEAEVRHAGGP